MLAYGACSLASDRKKHNASGPWPQGSSVDSSTGLRRPPRADHRAVGRAVDNQSFTAVGGCALLYRVSPTQATGPSQGLALVGYNGLLQHFGGAQILGIGLGGEQ